jgi:hypothetical protein
MVDRSYKQREEQADRQGHEEEGKKQQGERKEGKRGNDTHQLGTCSNCVFRRISPLSSSPPSPPPSLL